MTQEESRSNSLQARLLALVLGLVTAVWLASVAWTWFDASHELDELLDGHLAQAAALLVVQQLDPEHDDGVADAPSLHKYAPRAAFQIFHEGRLASRSSSAGAAPMSSVARGFSTVRVGDESWRVFATQGAQRDVQVYVGEKMESRRAILWAVLRSMLLPLMFLLPLLAVAGWWAVRWGLSPLRDLSRLLGKRQPHALEPVALAGMPLELQPVVRSLNGLFERIGHMVILERRFTSDAAHELRTPIAGIRAQVQVALGAGADSQQLQHALHATLTGCDRATRLVEQLLTLARLEAESGASPANAAMVDLGAVAQRVAADLAPAALARQQALELDAAERCLVRGDETLTGVLVRNLMDNALRYSPDAARVLVSVTTLGPQVQLRVQDSGSGMTEEEMSRLGERFFRVLGHGQPGSGLGWSIVRRVAEVSGAQIAVARSASLGGLDVTVKWPA
jgi:two-component system sensor histidine kinase QseC